MPRKKLLVIYGPTAIGKTSLALQLAKEYQGEIISADSRQVYQGMDIGTGKDTEEGIKIWLLDVTTPDQQFSAYQWAQLAQKVIKKAWEKGRLPIVVGGSAFYLKVLLDGLGTEGVEPNWDLRKDLESLSLKELQKRAGKSNPLRWKKLNHSDLNNPRRLMRLIEVGLAKGGGKVGKSSFLKGVAVLGIYLDGSLAFLKKRIEKRVEQRLEQGLVGEIKNLLKKYSWDSPGLNCLAYKEFKGYFEKKKSLEEVKKEWLKDEIAYAKRQKLWFGKDKRFFKFSKEEKNYLDKIRLKMKQWSNEEKEEK